MEAHLLKVFLLVNGTMLGFNQLNSKAHVSSVIPHCFFHINYVTLVAACCPKLPVRIPSFLMAGTLFCSTSIFPKLWTVPRTSKMFSKYLLDTQWISDFPCREGMKGSFLHVFLDHPWSCQNMCYSHFAFPSSPYFLKEESSLLLPLRYHWFTP